MSFAHAYTMDDASMIEKEEIATTSSLVNRNIMVRGRRTSMRLEPAMWDALMDICRREKLSMHQLCSMVATAKPDVTSFTAAMRVFTMTYFRNASTEDGHSKAGHGSGFLYSAKKDLAWFEQKNTVGNMPATHASLNTALRPFSIR
jgi:predicted DNA-binding ribbon-helix-helix protein